MEIGFSPSDHSRPEPDQVTMTFLISNTPINDQQATQAIQSGGFTFQTTEAFAAGAIGATDGYAQGEWAKLKKLREDGTIVTVATTLGTYTSMAIMSITAPRNSKLYDAIQFSITFKLVVVVQNKLTRGVQSTDTRVGKKKSAGNKTPKDTTQQDIDPLRQVKDAVVGAGNKVLSGFGGT